jgi:hypothetical protein
MHCQIGFAMHNIAGKRAVMLCEFKVEGLNVSSFFTVVPCILILSKFLHQLLHKFFKRSFKIDTKTALTCFGVITILRERTI